MGDSITSVLNKATNLNHEDINTEDVSLFNLSDLLPVAEALPSEPPADSRINPTRSSFTDTQPPQAPMYEPKHPIGTSVFVQGGRIGGVVVENNVGRNGALQCQPGTTPVEFKTLKGQPVGGALTGVHCTSNDEIETSQEVK